MPRWIRRLLSWSVLGLTGTLIVVALLFSIARALLPMADGYKHHVEDWVAGRTGLVLSIGQLSLDWHGWTPRLLLREARLTDPASGQRQSVGEVALTPDWRASLRQREPVLAELAIGQLRIQAYQDDEGRLSLFPSEARPSDEPAPDVDKTAPTLDPGLLTRLRRLNITHFHLDVLDAGGETIPLVEDGLLHARFRDGRWEASARIEAPALSPEPLLARLELAPESRLQGRGYLRLDAVDMAALQNWLATIGPPTSRGQFGACRGMAPGDCAWALPEIDRGLLNAEVWLDLDAGRLASLTAELVVDSLHATRLRDGQYPVAQSRIERASSRLRWQSPGDGTDWSLVFDDLQVMEGGRAETPQRVWLAESEGSLHAAAEYIDLNALRTWLAVSPLPETIHESLAGMAPSGVVRNPRLEIRDGEVLNAFMALENLSWRGQGFLPSVGDGIDETEGLSAIVYKRPAGWIARLDEQGLTLDFHDEFNAPMHFDLARGVLYWLAGDSPRLFTPALELRNADLNARTRFDLSLPPDAAPVIALDMLFGDVPSHRVPGYLPRRVLDRDVLNWLDMALVDAGQVPRGRFVLNGDLGRFPFGWGGGYFEVRFDYEGLTLPYSPGWPVATGLAGEMAFINQSFAARIDQGQVLGVGLTHGQVEIPDFDAPDLKLDLSLRGPLDGQLAYLQQSPILAEGSLSAFEASGDADLDLHIDLPLHGRGRHTQVRGQLTLAGNSLSIPAVALSLTELEGPVSFDLARIESPGLRARMDGEPLHIRVSSDQAATEGLETRVTARGRLDPLFALRGRDYPLVSHVAGKAETEVAVRIPHDMARDPGRIDVESDLVGVEVDLPEPLGKTAEAPVAARARIDLDAGSPERVSVWLDERVAGRFWLDNGGTLLDGVALRFGGGELAETVPLPGGVHLAGSLPTLDLPAWRTARFTVAREVAEGLEQTADAPPGYLPIGGALMIDRLEAGALNLTRTQVDIDMRDARQWRYDIESLHARGALVLDRDAAGQVTAVDGHFDDLWVLPPSRQRELAARESDQAAEPAEPLFSLGDWPEVSLRVERFRFGVYALGNLRLNGAPQADGARWGLSELVLGRADLYQIHAHGLVSEQADGLQTELNVGLQSEQVGEALRLLGGSSVMRGGKLENAGFSLSWPGSLIAPDMDRMVGEGQFMIRDGTLEEVDTGVGRILGLLSVGALTRRLALDFRDVFSEGFAFDSIGGQLEYQDRKLYAKPVEIRSPSLVAIMNGNADLVSDELDYQMEVYADVGMLLPLIGTVAGGPLVGGAVFLVQQLLRQADTRIEPTLRYHVSGTIDHPKLERGRKSPQE